MIGRLAGILAERGEDHVLIDAGGVGYIVHVSDRTLAALPPAGEAAVLYTDLQVREDLWQLFGFPSAIERDWHRLLQTVQGVGARAALALTGALGAEGLARAVARGDAAALRAAPGIGPKLAGRVAMELRDRVPALIARAGAGAAAAAAPAPRGRAGRAPPAPAAAVPAAAVAAAEALSALVNLGYGQSEAAAAVAEAGSDEAAADPALLIRAALRRLAPKG
ncbi:MAG: Holliday junction branch migration protein RuvA [Rhodobacteraceae bacterium]|nr:Holliday junction branch migration protein RuvA [Paracoccaceae bacterium]